MDVVGAEEFLDTASSTEPEARLWVVVAISRELLGLHAERMRIDASADAIRMVLGTVR